MKQRQNKNLLSYAVFAIALLSFVVASPAFAASNTSLGPWTIKQETPSFSAGQCTGTSKACASAASSGADKVIARSTFALFDGHDAFADNNQKFNPNQVGTSPILTSSASVVKFTAGVNYNGLHTVASGATNYYQYSITIWDSIGPLGGCNGSLITGAGSHINPSSQTTCTQSNSGTNTYKMGVEHHTGSWNPGAGTTIVDYWNSPRKAQTNSMTICDNC